MSDRSRDGRTRPFVVLSGTIAAGKTTAAGVLSDALGLPTFLEDWSTNPYFARYYQNPRAWALQTHLHFYADAVRNHHAASQQGGIQDRGVQEMFSVFAGVMVRSGTLDGDGFGLAESLHQAITPMLGAPDLFVHLECSPGQALERIRDRGREAEAAIDLDYLHALGAQYKVLVADWQDSPVIVWDTEVHDMRTSSGRNDLVGAVRAGLTV